MARWGSKASPRAGCWRPADAVTRTRAAPEAFAWWSRMSRRGSRITERNTAEPCKPTRRDAARAARASDAANVFGTPELQGKPNQAITAATCMLMCRFASLWQIAFGDRQRPLGGGLMVSRGPLVTA